MNKELSLPPGCSYIIEDSDLSEVPLNIRRKASCNKALHSSRQVHDTRKDMTAKKRVEQKFPSSKSHKPLARDAASGGKDEINSSDTSLEYAVQIDKTSPNLTASQRLHLRKSQLSSKISQYKQDDFAKSKKLKHSDFNGDEELDNDTRVFNVPYSQIFAQRSKSNISRQSSSTFDSTRTSIMSSVSFGEADSSTCSEENDTSANSMNFSDSFMAKGNYSFLEAVDEDLSLEAENLSKLFHQNTITLLHEETRQRRDMMASTIGLNDKQAVNPHINYPNNGLAESDARNKSLDKLNFYINSPKGNYVSYTRPYWLPPKSMKEKKYHQRESQRIINNALSREMGEQTRKTKTMIMIEKEKEQVANELEETLLVNEKSGWKINSALLKNSPKLYYKGLPEKIRSKVWFSQMGNELNITRSDCEYYFDKALFLVGSKNPLNVLEIFETERCLNNGSTDILDSQALNEIDKTSPNTENDYHDSLKNLAKTIVSFLVYIKEVHYGEINNDAQLIDYISFYSLGLKNLTTILLKNFEDLHKTFIYLCNLFEKDYMRTCLSIYLSQNNMRSNEINECALFEQFETLFKRNNNRLYTHFKVIGLKANEYIPVMTLGLFSNTFNHHLSCQLLDIFSFEEELMISKCLCAFFKKVEYKLYGNKSENIDFLEKYQIGTRHHSKISFNNFKVDYDYEFLELIQRMN